MKIFTFAWIALSTALSCLGCRAQESRTASAGAYSSSSVPGFAGSDRPAAGTDGLRYARVFSLGKSGDTTVVRVHKPWQGSASDFTYRLVRRGGTASNAVIQVPLARAVTLTTTNLRHLETIGSLDALAGLGGGRYVCSPEIRSRLDSGSIRDVGEDVRLDVEAVVSLKPDLIFTYVVGNSSDGGLAKLAETGIPVAIEGSYMEETPLGRAEWIKFTAAFFDRRAIADSLFAVVDSSYNALAALARTAKRRPTVVVGAAFGGVWWVPTGRTYVGRFLADAGADYAWASDTTRGSLNLEMEAVLGRAGDAEIWLNAGDWSNLDDAEKQDPRNALFRSFREGRVYTNDAIKCDGGGRDFYETGASRPDWVLADLIAILHPELLPGHKLRWYRKLPKAS